MVDYYISSIDGDNGDDGLSEANAWADFTPLNSALNAGSIGAGDNIYLDRGSVWTSAGTSTAQREAATIRLRVSSGSVGNPITITTYGTGDLPRIDGGGFNNVLIWHVNDASTPSDYVTIQNLELTNNYQAHAIGLTNGVDNIIIEDCYLHDSAGGASPDYGGIRLGDQNGGGSGATNCTVRRCYIHDIHGEAIYFGSSGGINDNTNNCTAEDNVIINANGEGFDGKARTNTNTIQNNIMIGCGSYGTQLLKIGGYSYTVTGNVIGITRSSALDGIEPGAYWAALTTDGGYNNTVSDNLVYNITAASQAGIEIDGKNITCVNNTIVGCTRGISLDRVTGSDQTTHTIHTVHNNAFNSNTVDVFAVTSTTSLYDVDYSSYDGTTGIWNWGGSSRDFSYVTGTLGYEGNGITSAQGFAETSLYSLTAGSNLVGAGNATYGDDIGWLQYNGSPTLQDASTPAGLWLFESSSNLGYDQSGNGNHLTNQNGVTAASAIAPNGNSGADFESTSSQYLEITDGSQTGLAPTTGDFSFGGWFNAESLSGSNNILMAKFVTTGNQRSFTAVLTSAGVIQVLLDSDGTGIDTTIASASSEISASTDYHYVFVKKGTACTIYIDAIPVYNDNNNPQPHYSGIFDSTAAFQIGEDGGTADTFDGVMDDTFFINSALEISDIQNIYLYGWQQPVKGGWYYYAQQ